MMQLSHVEPVYKWGLEPCESFELSIITCVSARGVDTRRTHPGPGAASSRSNVADQISCSYGRQFRREQGEYYGSEKASSAAAPSQTNHLDLGFQNPRLFGAVFGFLASVFRSGMSATSKIAFRGQPCPS